MTGLVAISGAVLAGLFAAAAAGAAFTAGLIYYALRRRPVKGPDIPEGMKPGPADEILERRHLERNTGYGLLFILLSALWLPVVWLREPETNVDNEIELLTRSVERGERWFALQTSENPIGFSCARCHGPEAQGGQVPFTPVGEPTIAYPVPALLDVCSRLTVEGPGQIRETIMEGRESTPMPSWSIRFAGPMNDQQIQDLINYLVSIQTVPFEQNKCTNPAAAAETQET